MKGAAARLMKERHRHEKIENMMVCIPAVVIYIMNTILPPIAIVVRIFLHPNSSCKKN